MTSHYRGFGSAELIPLKRDNGSVDTVLESYIEDSSQLNIKEPILQRQTLSPAGVYLAVESEGSSSSRESPILGIVFPTLNAQHSGTGYINHNEMVHATLTDSPLNNNDKNNKEKRGMYNAILNGSLYTWINNLLNKSSRHNVCVRFNRFHCILWIILSFVIITWVLLQLSLFLFAQQHLAVELHHYEPDVLSTAKHFLILSKPISHLKKELFHPLHSTIKQDTLDSLQSVNDASPLGYVKKSSDITNNLSISSTITLKKHIINKDATLVHPDTASLIFQEGGNEVITSPILILAKDYPELKYTPDELFQLEINYQLNEKEWPYIGNDVYINQLFPNETIVLNRTTPPDIITAKDGEKTNMRLPRHYYNSLAVFPKSHSLHLHGHLGLSSTGKKIFNTELPLFMQELKQTIDPFPDEFINVEQSNNVSLNRIPMMTVRETTCDTIHYDLLVLEDVSIVITFGSTPVSILLRTLHSILNLTPPPLLREIILVQDHFELSRNKAEKLLELYVRTLPKVKYMHLPEKSGQSKARALGIQLSTAPIVIMIDSQIEVSHGWLEPLLLSLKKNPKSFVFPKVFSIHPQTFAYDINKGTGCAISFQWNMQEYSELVEQSTTSPSSLFDYEIPSPILTNAVFGFKRKWYLDLRGYDLQLTQDGVAHIGLSFRIWQCGGKILCIPCSIVYHIYPNNLPFLVPSQQLMYDRLRIGRLWTQTYYPLVQQFISGHIDDVDVDMYLGQFDQTLSLQEQLHCKDFNWYLKDIVPNKVPKNIQDIQHWGQIINQFNTSLCLDTPLFNALPESSFGVFLCNNTRSQLFFTIKNQNLIRLVANEYICLGKNLSLLRCDTANELSNMLFNPMQQTIQWLPLTHIENSTGLCLTLSENEDIKVHFLPCEKEANLKQQWSLKEYVQPNSVQPLPTYTPNYVQYKNRLQKRYNNDSPI